MDDLFGSGPRVPRAGSRPAWIAGRSDGFARAETDLVPRLLRTTYVMRFVGRAATFSSKEVKEKRAAKLAALSVGIGILVIIVAALLVFGLFERGVTTTRGRELCDNSMCLRLPAGWDGRTESGGIAGRLIAAPFRLPRWVGQHEQGVIEIPEGRFVILLSNFDRGYLFGWPRTETLAVSRRRLRAEPKWAIGDRSFTKTAVTFRGRSVDLLVEFADPKPSEDQFASVNRVLATLHPAPPPVITH